MYISVSKHCTSTPTTERPEVKQQISVLKQQAIFRCFDEFKNTLSCTGYSAGIREELLNAQVCPALKGYHHQGIYWSPKEEAGTAGTCDSMSEQLVLTGLTAEGAANTLRNHAGFYPPLGKSPAVCKL